MGKPILLLPQITAVLGLSFLIKVKEDENISYLPVSGSDATIKQPYTGGVKFSGFHFSGRDSTSARIVILGT